MGGSTDAHWKRRQRLLNRLGDGLLILPTAQQRIRNGDVLHSFRPGSDLRYLCGFPEPEAILVAWREGRGDHRSVLFVLPKDPERETWDGRRHGVRGAVREFGVDEAHPIGDFVERLEKLLANHGRVFVTLGRSESFDQQLFRVFARRAQARRRSAPAAHPVLQDPQPALAGLRRIKSADEIRSMERAAAITVAGHRAAMAAARAGDHEYQVQAVLEAEFRAAGSERNGYDSIVASGPNACTLHYTENRRQLRRGDLMLIDAGAEYEGYTADITRTWPVDPAFRPAQRAVYEVVLKAQRAAVRAVQPGKPWNAPHRAANRTIARGLLDLGLLRGSLDSVLAKDAQRQWFMHGTSHWLGMDVHDVGSYEDADGRPAKLAAGMVLTVEPGLYFAPGDRSVPREFRGVGVRIEDDVLVTRSGHRNLTEALPRTVAEIEAMRQEAASRSIAKG